MEGSGFVYGSQNFGFLFRGWFAPGDAHGPEQDGPAFSDFRFQIVAFFQAGRFPDDVGQRHLRGAANLHERHGRFSRRGGHWNNPFKYTNFVLYEFSITPMPAPVKLLQNPSLLLHSI